MTFPTFSYCQDFEVTVFLEPPVIDYYKPYCELLDITIEIENNGASEVFTGRVSADEFDFFLVSIGSLANPVQYTISRNPVIDFTTPGLATNNAIRYEYQVMGKTPGPAYLKIYKKVRRPSTAQELVAILNFNFEENSNYLSESGLDVSNFQNGIYFGQYKDFHGNILNFRFLKIE